MSKNLIHDNIKSEDEPCAKAVSMDSMNDDNSSNILSIIYLTQKKFKV